MFGYVMPVRAELRVRDFDTYRSVYCGVCKQLQKSYGFASRFLLNYDLVLLGLLSDAVLGETGNVQCEGCFVAPLNKRPTRHSTSGLELAADGLVLLSYHKLCDNLADEKLLKRIGYTLAKPLFKSLYKKAAKRRPQLAETIGLEMRRQAQLEAASCKEIDEACEPTAKMCEALFGAIDTDEGTRKILRRLGLFCGQIVYLLDAAEDFDDDAKSGSYNVFHKLGLTREEAAERAKRRCRMAAGEIALCYNLLELRQNKDILDNIFFLGLPAGIHSAGEKRNRRPNHGQIESV